MADDQVRAAVFFSNDDERRQAEEAFRRAPPESVEAYSGVIEGWLTPAHVEELIDAGFAVDVIEPETHVAPPPRRLDIPADVAEGLKAATRYARMEGDSNALVIDETETEAIDRRIHVSVDYDPSPAPEDALPSDVYYLSLTGPITREQRLEFDSFGVDIGAFVPPNRYRTFLTPDQYKRVQELPYVTHVVRRPFEDTLTPELIAVASETPGAGPALMAAGEDSSLRTFDLLLHRERDLPEIRHLIEETEGTRVIAESNLRIRFEGPVNRPLLAALAALPQVRKLSVYEPPRI
jgi:hypothetical protein